MNQLVPLAILANLLVIGMSLRIDPIRLPSPVQQAQAATTSFEPVVCYACVGTGTLIRSQKGQQNLPYTCTVCRGSGKRVIEGKPANADICPDCQGMGRMPDRSLGLPGAPMEYRINARRCVRCGGTGWVQPRHHVF